MFLLLTMVSGKMQEKKVAVAAAAPPEEELNPYTIFPQPEENFKVCD
jgi:glutaminyl-tRNA synthetase